MVGEAAPPDIKSKNYVDRAATLTSKTVANEAISTAEPPPRRHHPVSVCNLQNLNTEEKGGPFRYRSPAPRWIGSSRSSIPPATMDSSLQQWERRRHLDNF
ncbi:hypothetical protein ACP275_04G135700 [Erythranthe tilingii]